MKTFKTCFSAVFMALLILPGIFMNRKEDAVSESEKRKLAEKPQLYAEDGSLNRNFTADFETYFNDRIGFRDRMVMTNAQVQYYVFGQIDRGGIYNLGPHGELNYIGGKVLKDYTRTNLPDEAELLAAENAFRILPALFHLCLKCSGGQRLVPGNIHPLTKRIVHGYPILLCRNCTDLTPSSVRIC